MRKQKPPLAFNTDGCSGGLSVFWVNFFGTRPPFEQCCYWHDCFYWQGGGPNKSPWRNFIERLQADNTFFACMWRSGSIGKLLSIPVWFAVRIGGGSYWRMPYSWGFGWRE